MRGRAVAFFLSATVFAGCGGGGGSESSTASAVGPIPFVTSTPSKPVVTPAPAATPTPIPTASVSKAISATAGGTASTVLDGQTVTVTIPPGALSASTNVTLSVYTKAGLPRLFQSRLRTTKSLPTGTAFISGMGVTIGSATLTKPLSFSLTGAAKAPAATVVRLAASLQGSFGDVDTATQTNGAITEAQNPAYAGVSLVGPSILFAFYNVASANALPAPTRTVSVSGPSSVAGGAQAQYSAAQADANGFPFLTAAYSYSLDSAALGTIDAATGVLTAAPTPANNTLGHVIATDRNSTIAGSLAISILSSRPATAGDSISYAGTFASTLSNNAIASTPVTSSQSGTVTQTIAVGAGSANQLVVTANESDAFQLSTLTTKTTSTIAYQTSGASTGIRLLQSTATDSNNATYQTQYTATSGLLTVEPENAGTFGPNDASQTYSETDPGIAVGASGQLVTTVRTTAANGSYNELTTNADGSTNTAIQNADGTGSYKIETPNFGLIALAFGLPTTGANPTIPINLVAASQNVNEALNATLWYPSPLTQYSESDTIAASSAYDSRCSVPAAYGTASAKVTQSITSIDAVYGNVENQTTTTYDVVGVGTVCSIMSDTTQTFYDYSGQEPHFFSYSGSAAPLLASTTTEVLSITAATVSGQPLKTASSKRLASSLSHLAIVVGRERFRHAVHKAKMAQAARMASTLRRLQGVH